MSDNNQTEVFERMDIHNMNSFNQHLLNQASENKESLDIESVLENQQQINNSFIDYSQDFKQPTLNNPTKKTNPKKIKI